MSRDTGQGQERVERGGKDEQERVEEGAGPSI